MITSALERPLCEATYFRLGHFATCHFANCYGQPEKSTHFQIESASHSADLSAILSEGQGKPLRNTQQFETRAIEASRDKRRRPADGFGKPEKQTTPPLHPHFTVASTSPHSRLPDSLLSFNQGVRDGQEIAVQDAGHWPDGLVAVDSAGHGGEPDQRPGAAAAGGSGQYCQQRGGRADAGRAGAGDSLPGDGRGSGRVGEDRAAPAGGGAHAAVAADRAEYGWRGGGGDAPARDLSGAVIPPDGQRQRLFCRAPAG